ncbi:response regulator [Paenibacillus larvae]
MSHEQKKRVYTVLLIEDDPMVQEVNRQFIERVEGFRVIGTAATGSEGLRLVRELEPDLIFLDIYMPSQDGTEALRKLRAEALPVDVIVVTAAKDAPTIRQMIRKGIRDYIIKPFKFERVRDALEQFRAHHTALMAEGTLSQVELDEILHRTGERSGEYSESGAEGLACWPQDYFRRGKSYDEAGLYFEGQDIQETAGRKSQDISSDSSRDKAALVEGKPGIKTAGIQSAIAENQPLEKFPDLSNLPKGLNLATMRQIIYFVRQQKKALSAEEVADGVGIARVTARRYLDYLEKSRQVRLVISYGGIGRPINRYEFYLSNRE